MANDNTLSVIIKLRDQASKQMDAVSKKVNNLGKNVSSMADKTNIANSKMSASNSRLSQSFTMSSQEMARFKVIAAASAVAIAGVGVMALQKAGEMQVFGKQFKVLLGDAELAEERLRELAEFGAKTPFELPGVVRASIVLETLTGGALATGEGLKLVGDAAAASNQPFQDIAVHIGRAYDAIKSGRPFGESAMRLQELGLITGDTRGEIEDLTS